MPTYVHAYIYIHDIILFTQHVNIRFGFLWLNLLVRLVTAIQMGVAVKQNLIK